MTSKISSREKGKMSVFAHFADLFFSSLIFPKNLATQIERSTGFCIVNSQSEIMRSYQQTFLESQDSEH